MPNRDARRPMPIEQAILWKPLHDSHYVVASLQPVHGGRRTIFVRQQVLFRAQTLVRTHGRHACGILLGHGYRCPVTDAEFLVIESLDERGPVNNEHDLAPTIAEALATLAHHRGFHIGLPDRHADVVGWYRGVSSVEAKPTPGTAEVHDSLFKQPWQTTLLIAESARSPGGAFFLHDTANRCWFLAPFYELPDHLTKPPQPKPTVLTWPQYMTSDTVALGQTAVPELSGVETAPVEQSRGAPAPVTGNGDHRGTHGRGDEPQATPALDAQTPMPTSPPIVPPTRDSTAPRIVDDEAPRSNTRPMIDLVARLPVHDEAGNIERRIREGRPGRRGGRPVEKLSIVDDRDQTMAAPPVARPVRDDEDTAPGDDPGRYIELARNEGFFIAARYETPSNWGVAETLWILNDPYAGMLLVVVTTDSAVIDATLHYNVQTDDAGLQRVPFPEHRDPESKTIYVRETCADGLRARCRRLRATNALLREWRVTPTLSFLTPAEWESVSAFDMPSERALDPIRELNDTRIAELPPGVRSQFHLDTPGESKA
jgi:hypothetical protein